MEDIVKFLIKKEYKNLESIMHYNLSNDDWGNLTHTLFFMHLNNYIDDKQIFCFFYLVQNKINFKKFTYLTLNKLNNKSKRIHKFLKNKMEIILIDDGVSEIILKFKFSNKYKYKSLNKDNFYKYVHGEFNNLISSHIDKRFIDFIQTYYEVEINKIYKTDNSSIVSQYSDSPVNIDNSELLLKNENTNSLLQENLKLKESENHYLKTTHSDIHKNWIMIHEHQIKERLQTIIKMFNFKLLEFMNIQIITNIQYDYMSYLEKVNYYKLCLGKLTSSLNTVKEIANKQKKLNDLDKNFSNDYEIIQNPIKLNKVENKKFGIKYIDYMLNDLVDQYFDY